MTFAERLRELRDKAGLSEAALANLSGLALPTLHDYGLGRRHPSFRNVVKLAKALGTDCRAFADCDDVIGDEPQEKAPSGTKGQAKGSSAKPTEGARKAKSPVKNRKSENGP